MKIFDNVAHLSTTSGADGKTARTAGHRKTGHRGRLSVIFLVPDLVGSTGGIGRCCKMVALALSHSGATLTVIALNDPRNKSPEYLGVPSTVCYSACGGSRVRFVMTALAALRVRPTVVLLGHAHFAPLGKALGWLSKTPVSVFIHGVEVWSRLPVLRRWALCRVDQLIAVSKFTACTSARTNGTSLARTRILYHCVDPTIAPDSKARHEPVVLSLLTVSRILKSEQYKGHDVIIRALPQLLEKYPGLTYHVVGDGDGRRQMEELAIREKVASSVRFHGVVSDHELSHYYDTSSVFVMPSRREGFGIVFLEAMAHHLPVVAGNVDATVEVVRNGETGFLVDPGSTTELADAVSKLLADADLRRRMGGRAAQIVASDFSFSRFSDMLLTYMSELGRSRRPWVRKS